MIEFNRLIVISLDIRVECRTLIKLFAYYNGGRLYHKFDYATEHKSASLMQLKQAKLFRLIVSKSNQK